jgi:hypothetical protein
MNDKGIKEYVYLYRKQLMFENTTIINSLLSDDF